MKIHVHVCPCLDSYMYLFIVQGLMAYIFRVLTYKRNKSFEFFCSLESMNNAKKKKKKVRKKNN